MVSFKLSYWRCFSSLWIWICGIDGCVKVCWFVDSHLLLKVAFDCNVYIFKLYLAITRTDRCSCEVWSLSCGITGYEEPSWSLTVSSLFLMIECLAHLKNANWHNMEGCRNPYCTIHTNCGIFSLCGTDIAFFSLLAGVCTDGPRFHIWPTRRIELYPPPIFHFECAYFSAAEWWLQLFLCVLCCSLYHTVHIPHNCVMGKQHKQLHFLVDVWSLMKLLIGVESESSLGCLGKFNLCVICKPQDNCLNVASYCFNTSPLRKLWCFR